MTKSKCNIILITIDALRRDRLGCYGSPYSTSPNIDRLAEGSLLFENAYTIGFGTDPIHTSIFTGLLPQSHGIIHHGPHVTRGEVEDFLLVKNHFLPNILQEVGYRTFAVDLLGRWHRTGFDHYSGYLANVLQKGRNEIYRRLRERRLLHKLLPYSISRFFFDSMSEYNSAATAVQHAKGKISGTRQPFLLFLHFWDTHTPYDPPSQYVSIFKDVATEHNTQMDVVLNNIPDARFKRYMTGCAYGTKDSDEMVHRYLGSIRYVDDQIGNLLSYLESMELLDNTLLILAADHGEHLGEHGVYFEHHTVFNEILRVPLILRFPDGKQGRIKALCQLTDITPTILDYLDIKRDFVMDGRSVMPLIEADDTNTLIERDIFFGRTGESTGTEDRNGIIKGQYKYTLGSEESRKCRRCGFIHHEREELFELENDPLELHNVAGMQPDKTKELKMSLTRFLEESRKTMERRRIRAKIRSPKTSGEI